ncbi:hypothetical protein T08_8872 [Trichinella sp. T8]|nr:hypothetical protein T08_8872 [Trichinella sp. T8]
MTSWGLPRSPDFIESYTARLLSPHFRSVATNYCKARAELHCYKHIFYIWLADSNPSSRDYWVGLGKTSSLDEMETSETFRKLHHTQPRSIG